MEMRLIRFDLARIQLSLDILPEGPQQVVTETQYHTTIVGSSQWDQE
jgi:hypothetical protein